MEATHFWHTFLSRCASVWRFSWLWGRGCEGWFCAIVQTMLWSVAAWCDDHLHWVSWHWVPERISCCRAECKFSSEPDMVECVQNKENVFVGVGGRWFGIPSQKSFRQKLGLEDPPCCIVWFTWKLTTDWVKTKETTDKKLFVWKRLRDTHFNGNTEEALCWTACAGFRFSIMCLCLSTNLVCSFMQLQPSAKQSSTRSEFQNDR